MTMMTKTTDSLPGLAAEHRSASRTPRRDKIIYWSTTAIVATVMLWSAINFQFNPAMRGAATHLGLPDWFRVELTTMKIIGTFALVIPRVPDRIKEAAYFGFALVLVSASIAHLASGDGLQYELFHLMFFASLVVSYRYWHKGAARSP
jgi:putative oxidoreductase